MYNPFRQIKKNKLPIKLKIFYFSLEMSAEEKLTQMISNLLFLESKGTIVKSPQELRSTKDAVNSDIMKAIDNNNEYIKEFLNCVTYIDNIRNPYGIYHYMRKYALDNGTMHKKTINIDGVPTEVDDFYEPNNPEEYVLPIVDHAKLLTKERQHTGIWDTIADLSSNYFILLRNKYKQSPVLVQQQASSQESIANEKMGRLRPTLDGLGDNKTTQQDANVILGLFSPFRHHIAEYEKYDVKFYKDNIRFLEILGGREGGAGTICPLYFNGAVNYFDELPRVSDREGLAKFNQKIIQIKKYETQN